MTETRNLHLGNEKVISQIEDKLNKKLNLEKAENTK